MTRRWMLLSVIVALWSPAFVFSPAAVPGKNILFFRGQQEEIYFYPARGATRPPVRKILFVPGDGGWRGFAITMAERMASWGYDVYGLDTKRYLESFTGKTILQVSDVRKDFEQMAGWMRQGSREPIALVGWSEGAGLCLLAAASENKQSYRGLISIGLGESNLLGWRWSDFLSYITKRNPNEPKFMSADFLSMVAPLPFYMIQSSHDDYVPTEAAKQLFSVAREPKQFSLIEAQNHRFDGNRGQFFQVLREGLQWIAGQAR